MFARRRLRCILRQLHYVDDQIAFFDLPALEIDKEVDGLMVIRGITISLSTLTAVAHGIEVAVKFSDDLELALIVDEVKVSLFRRVDVGHVYGNVKGGEFEMTFGKLAPSTSADGDPYISTDTPLLAAAAKNGDTTTRPGSLKSVKRTEDLTHGRPPKATSVDEGLGAIEQLSVDDHSASKKYHEIIQEIKETSMIYTSRKEVEAALAKKDEEDNIEDAKDKRAAICTQLHAKPSIPHPPERSIKLTTIKNRSNPRIKRFLHRLPMLYRAMLMPISYFHPVFIQSITVGGSGKWLQQMLQEQVFKDYAEQDSAIRNLKQRVSSWLSDANFVLQLADITGLANVPMNTSYDIVNHLAFDDVLAYRTLPKEVSLKQVVRLAGADARVTVPSFLIPHHEHLLPPKPNQDDERDQQKKIDEADGLPQTVQAEHELEQMQKDETNVNISAHVRLPACFDQELLDFVAALVKATKVIEMEKEHGNLDKDVRGSGIKEFTKALKSEVKDGMRKVAVDAAANDRWIAKLVGKVTKKLETIQGDVGYSGDLPVPLKVYRDKAESDTKLMP